MAQSKAIRLSKQKGEQNLPTIDEIWSDDLLGRKKEGAAIAAYIESFAARRSLGGEEHAHVFAVDANYGEGKTFFLKKLAKQLALNHPVAYVDAWKDDLNDEPLTAIAATLEDAIEEFADRSTSLSEHLSDWRSKAGAVLKISSVGVAKRLLGLAITQGAADAVGDALFAEAGIKSDFSDEAIKKLGEDLPDQLLEATKSGEALMEQRVRAFRAGQAAIVGVKSALSKVVENLDSAGTHAPIVIIIDELDRCRPTYAIKLLEEVKHLFDVSGVVFVLGIHGDQLIHSISKSYGANFNSSDYLRRFIHRYYKLKPLSLNKLVEKSLRDLNVDVARLSWPSLATENIPASRYETKGPAEAISIYLGAYGITARDAFRVIEMLHLSLTLTKPYRLAIPLFLPLICSTVLRLNDTLPRQSSVASASFYNHYKNSYEAIKLDELANRMLNYSGQGIADLSRSNDPVASYILEFLNNITTEHLAHPKNYRDLMYTVARFGH